MAAGKIWFSMALLFFATAMQAQEGIGGSMLKTLRGKMVTYASLTVKDSVVLVCLWSTQSEESIAELNAINAKYENWKSSLPFTLLAVSVDENNANRVKPTVNMNGWTFGVYIDESGDLRRALNAGSIPQSMILRGGRLIYKQSGYESGSEKYLFQKMLEIAGYKSPK
jgi:cytochrome c biogenesis protein CcmG/thiol:disulfide interchange protein DsbE